MKSVNVRLPIVGVLVCLLVSVLAIFYASPTPAATVTYNLFGTSAPVHNVDSEVANLELGTVFSSTKAGNVTAIRFYKTSLDTGQHTGKLYNNRGKLLASKVFTNETASGWQTVTLNAPVAIKANTNYTVSHTTRGRYAANNTFFAGGPVANGVLTAKSGTYRYGAGYPTNKYLNTNYFSDVLVGVQEVTPVPTTSTPATTTTTAVPTETVEPTTTTTVAPTTTTATPTETVTATPTETVTVPPGSSTPMLDYYKKWSNGPRFAANDFPFGPWLQDPSKYDGDVARQYKSMGVNMYVGMWAWPGGSYAGHAQQIQDALAANGAQALGPYSAAGVTKANTTPNGNVFRGWILEDEPDMREIHEDTLAAMAADARKTDPTRPTYVNFSKGIVNCWNGSRCLTEQDKREYCASADIASVDFYGFTDPWEGRPGAPGYLKAMNAMKAACGNDKPIWGFVETTRPFDSTRITPDQFEVATWTLLAAGADGIELFIHDFGPDGSNEDALLYDSRAASVKQRVPVVSAQIKAAAPLLNQADKPSQSSNANVLTLGKPSGMVVVNMQPSSQTATVTCAGIIVTETLAPYEHKIHNGSC